MTLDYETYGPTIDRYGDIVPRPEPTAPPPGDWHAELLAYDAASV